MDGIDAGGVAGLSARGGRLFSGKLLPVCPDKHVHASCSTFVERRPATRCVSEIAATDAMS